MGVIEEIYKHGCNPTSLTCNPLPVPIEKKRKDFWLYILGGILILIVFTVSIEVGRIRGVQNEINKKSKELKKL